jgi:Tfp pilus assembly protein PilO
MRLLIPGILIAAAIGLFAMFTNPAFQRVKALQVKSAELNGALDNAKELVAERDRLNKKLLAFEQDKLDKVKAALPDNVDNIRLIIDINNVAARHGLSLRNVQLGTLSDGKTARSALAVGTSGEAVGSVEVGFSLTADYESFLAFVYDLEHSLRILDIEKITLKPEQAGRYAYDFTIRTYWLH